MTSVPLSIDLSQLSFAEPLFLWLLVVPALLTVAWVWRLLRRRRDLRALASRRTVPVIERYAVLGDLPFWLCLIVASALLIVALARPRGPAAGVRQGGIDLVILQDGSASMRVRDVAGDRWQRSVAFLRTLGDALNWKQDRIALALFAHIAAPQVRLTKDPNTYFFFLDHLDKAPPFPIDDVTTWDTNLELGVHWGIRLIERDEEIHGKSSNAKMFIMLSDGESWSGEVANSLKQATAHNIPLYAVGVGSLAGGAMPLFHNDDGEVVNDPEVPSTSRLDRVGLQRIAMAGGGQYFELDRDGDRRIANSLIDAGRRRAPSRGTTEESDELYWRFVAAAALFPFVGLLFLRDRPELWLQTVGAVAVTVAVFSILQ